MNERFVQSHEAVLFARDALRRGDRAKARQWAERAAELAPQSEDPWLILAAVASPRESVDFIRNALQVNPESARAQKGMEWALSRLREMPEQSENLGITKQVKVPARSVFKKKPYRMGLLIPVLLMLLGCIVVGFAAWFAMTSPVLASILNRSRPQIAQRSRIQPFAEVVIPKPTHTALPAGGLAFDPTAISTEPLSIAPSATPTDPPVVVPTDTPLEVGTLPPEPIVSPEATQTPGTIYAEIVPDTPTAEYAIPAPGPNEPNVPPAVASADGAHWIDVDLSQQRVYAYAGDTIVNSFLASTGTWQFPTVTGKYKIWIKLLYTDMAGPGYYLPDVPYTMYFYKGYGIHGTYWHNNFGTPMSHGCVNLSIPDAAWLYDFSAVGTTVNVHY